MHDYEKRAAINDGSFVRITNGYKVTGNITTGDEFGASRGWFQSQATNGLNSGITLFVFTYRRIYSVMFKLKYKIEALSNEKSW